MHDRIARIAGALAILLPGLARIASAGPPVLQQPDVVSQPTTKPSAIVAATRHTSDGEVGCAAAGIARLALRDENGADLPLVADTLGGAAGCLAYASIPGEVNSMALVVTSASRVASLVARGGVADTASSGLATDNARLRFTPITRRTQLIPIDVLLRSGTDTGAHKVTLDLYVARVPALRLSEHGSTCDVMTVCRTDSLAATVILTGTNLEEVNVNEPVRLVGPGSSTTAVAFPLDRAGPDIVFRLPAASASPPGPGVYTVTVRTRSAYRRNPSVNDDTNEVALAGLTIGKQPVGIPEYHFTDATGGETTLWVGESISRQLDKTGQLKVGGVYSIYEGQATARHVVAILEVGDKNRARLTGVAPTVQPFRKAGLPTLDVVEKDSIRGHMLLQVVNPPRVDRVLVHHLLSAYSDSAVRRKERVVLTLTGQTLGAFGDPKIASRDGTIIGTSPRIHNDRTIVLDVQVAPTAGDELPVILGAPTGENTGGARDTAAMVPVVLPQRPHPLGFASVGVKKQQHKLAMLPWRHTTQTDSIYKPTTDIQTSIFDSVEVDFSAASADSDGTYGPQYLIVDAGYYGDDGKLITRDSARLVIVPTDPTPYRIAPGFDRTSSVRIDHLLGDLPRFAKPGAYLEIRLHHDPAEYENGAGEAATIRISDNSRINLVPRFDVLTGLTYVKRNRETRFERRAIANGSAVGDTVIRRTERTNYDVNFLDVTGGASAALDFMVLKSDFKPSFARMRIALLFVTDPFDSAHKRRFSGGLMYPVELVNLKGALDLSLSLGYGWQLGGRSFYVVAPGVGFSLPKL